jgi:K+-sensing histidine kinase KdpD
MAREVNDTQPFQDKVVKLIPTEIVGAYLVILGIIAPTSETTGVNKNLLMFVFFFLLLLTPIYLWKVSGVANWVQLVVSTLSYVIWIYTLVYPFYFWKIYYPTVGAVILVLWSLITPFFVTANKDAPTDAPAPV